MRTAERRLLQTCSLATGGQVTERNLIISTDLQPTVDRSTIAGPVLSESDWPAAAQFAVSALHDTAVWIVLISVAITQPAHQTITIKKLTATNTHTHTHTMIRYFIFTRLQNKKLRHKTELKIRSRCRRTNNRAKSLGLPHRLEYELPETNEDNLNS